jgi:hypothetical protein
LDQVRSDSRRVRSIGEEVSQSTRGRNDRSGEKRKEINTFFFFLLLLLLGEKSPRPSGLLPSPRSSSLQPPSLRRSDALSNASSSSNVTKDVSDLKLPPLRTMSGGALKKKGT